MFWEVGRVYCRLWVVLILWTRDSRVVLIFEMYLGRLGMKWKVNGKCSDCRSVDAVLDFAVVLDGRFGLFGQGDVLKVVCRGGCGGDGEVDIVVAVVRCRIVGVGLV